MAEDGSGQAPRLAAEAEELARSCGAERAEAHAALTLATFRCINGDPAGLAELRACIAPARSLRCALEAGRAYHNLAAYSYQFGRYTDVLELEPEALDYCAAAGIYRVYGIMVELAVIHSLARLGHWPAAEARVTRVCAEFGDQPVEHFTLAGSWGLIAIRQGRLDGVGDMIADAAARMHDHASALGSTATAAVELAGADGRVGDIPPIVDVALDRILPRFARDAADLVASAVGALADLAPQDGLRSASNRLEDIDHRVDGWRVQVEHALHTNGAGPHPGPGTPTRTHPNRTGQVAWSVAPSSLGRAGPRLGSTRRQIRRFLRPPATRRSVTGRTGWALRRRSRRSPVAAVRCPAIRRRDGCCPTRDGDRHSRPPCPPHPRRRACRSPAAGHEPRRPQVRFDRTRGGSPSTRD